MTNERESLDAALRIERFLYRRVCGSFGHWLTYVEPNHARCRICRYHFFFGHASNEQIERWLVG